MLTPSSLFQQFHSVLAQGSQWTGRCVGTGANSDIPTIQGLECLFANVLKVVTTFAGLGFFIMVVLAGFQFIGSQGNPKSLETSSNILTNAVIGLVGIIGSYLILKLISDFIGDSSILLFKIPVL